MRNLLKTTSRMPRRFARIVGSRRSAIPCCIRGFGTSIATRGRRRGGRPLLRPDPRPFQMLGAAICCVLFRVNLPLALLSTLYTNPFTIVPLYLAAFGVGEWLIGSGSVFTPPPELAPCRCRVGRAS